MTIPYNVLLHRIVIPQALPNLSERSFLLELSANFFKTLYERINKELLAPFVEHLLSSSLSAESH